MIKEVVGGGLGGGRKRKYNHPRKCRRRFPGLPKAAAASRGSWFGNLGTFVCVAAAGLSWRSSGRERESPLGGSPNPTGGVGVGFLSPPPRFFPVPGGPYLHAALALVRFFAAVDALVALQVVFLDEAHVAHVALEGLLAWERGGKPIIKGGGGLIREAPGSLRGAGGYRCG